MPRWARSSPAIFLKFPMKTCRKCQRSKEDGEFRPKRRVCKACCNAADKRPGRPYDRERYRANPELYKERQRKWYAARPMSYKNAYLKRMYGITLEDYNTMLAEQGGVCAICGGPPNGKGAESGSFYVDHDHVTQVVRGLLCHYCNLLLGCAKDDSGILTRAVDYILKHKNREPG